MDSDTRSRYDNEVSINPDISHTQAMQLAGARKVLKDLVKEGKDIDIDEPNVQKEIFERLAVFLRKNAQAVWEEVKDTFERVIDYLGKVIIGAIVWVDEHIIDPIREFFT